MGRPHSPTHRVVVVLSLLSVLPALGCYSMQDVALRGKTSRALRDGDEIAITGWSDSSGSYHAARGSVREISDRSLELAHAADPLPPPRPPACDTLSRSGVRSFTVHRFDLSKTIIMTGLNVGIVYLLLWGAQSVVESISK
jgi:hypothetical protein